MQKPSTQGVGGAAVHVVPQMMTPVESLALSFGIAYEPNPKGWKWTGYRLHDRLPELTEKSSYVYATTDLAARAALRAIADAINERLRR